MNSTISPTFAVTSSGVKESPSAPTLIVTVAPEALEVDVDDAEDDVGDVLLWPSTS
jgi:hypothetical protein